MTRTKVAVLGTLAEFHREPIPYDLQALVRLVSALRPDLLCLDLTPQQWRQHDFHDLPPEYRDALLPLAHQTDIVVAPIAEHRPPVEAVARGWRGRVIALLRRGLAYLQRTAPNPAAMNAGWRHHFANALYDLIAALAQGNMQHARRAHIDHLVRQVLEVARRDPGARVLVVVNVQYCHHVRPALKKFPEVDVVPYTEL